MLDYMMDDTPTSVDRDSLLSAEERRQMTERNRAEHAAMREQSMQTPSEQLVLMQQEQLDRERLRRLQESERNRYAAGSREMPYVSAIPSISPISMVAGSSAVAADVHDEYDEAYELPYVDSDVSIPDPAEFGDDCMPAQNRQRFTLYSAASRFQSVFLRNRNSHRVSPIAGALLAVLALLFIGNIIYGKMRTNQIYSEIAALEAEYDDWCAKNMSLETSIKGKMTAKNIEEYAENELGLKPLDDSQISYVTIQTEDEIVIADSEEDFWSIMGNYFTSLFEYLRGE